MNESDEVRKRARYSDREVLKQNNDNHDDNNIYHYYYYIIIIMYSVHKNRLYIHTHSSYVFLTLCFC